MEIFETYPLLTLVVIYLAGLCMYKLPSIIARTVMRKRAGTSASKVPVYPYMTDKEWAENPQLFEIESSNITDINNDMRL